jgi:hypothetical protein
MVGGEAAQLERALPVFNAVGKTITHVGAHGAGQMAKLVNQILVVVNMLAAGEALLFAQAGGLDLQKTLDAVSQGAAGSWMLNNRGPQVIRRDWRPGFTIDLQQKDVRLILDAADQLGVPCWGRVWSSTSTAPCRRRASAAKAITRWSRRWNTSRAFRSAAARKRPFRIFVPFAACRFCADFWR